MQTCKHTIHTYTRIHTDRHLHTHAHNVARSFATPQRIPNVVIHRVIHHQNLVADPVTRVAARATHVTHIAGCAKCVYMFRNTHRNADRDCDGRVRVDQGGSAGQVEGGVR